MKTIAVVGFAMFMWLGSFVHAAEVPPDFPNELRARSNGGLPVWVAAEDAIDEKGELRSSKVGEHSVLKLRQLKALRDRGAQEMSTDAPFGEGCVGFSTLPTPEHYRRNATIRDLSSEANDVVVGRVVSRKEGFFRGDPASLIRIEVATVLRASDDLRFATRDVFLVYPYANLRINGSMHCSRVPGLDYEPIAGDRVVIFKYLPSASREAVLIEADARRELIFEHEGRLIVAPILGSDPSLEKAITFDELVALVRLRVSTHDQAVKEAH